MIHLNNGVQVDSISVLTGCDTTKTTELYYCRKVEYMATEAARKVWRNPEVVPFECLDKGK